MSDTARFGMPLLDAAQAQKHVTVNEALVRVDALGSGRVEGRELVMPPASPTDGLAWIVATGAMGEWAGHDGEIALYLNGGWAFVVPWVGATAWVAPEGLRVTWTGAAWIAGHAAGSPGGAATVQRVIELEQTLAGTSTVTATVIPDKAVVFGVTGRVTAAITGATGWSLGVPGAIDRYGTGYGTSQASFAHGVTGQAVTYYGATALEITAEGGAFSAGTLRLAVHCLEISPPAAI